MELLVEAVRGGEAREETAGDLLFLNSCECLLSFTFWFYLSQE